MGPGCEPTCVLVSACSVCGVVPCGRTRVLSSAPLIPNESKGGAAGLGDARQSCSSLGMGKPRPGDHKRPVRQIHPIRPAVLEKMLFRRQ